MIRFALVALCLIWALWLLGIWANIAAVGFLVSLGHVLVGVALSRIRVNDGLDIQRFLRWLGVSLVLLGVADACWNLVFPGGQANLGDTLWILLIFVGAAMVGAWASLDFYISLRGLFGYPRSWVWIPISVGLVVGVWSYWLGASELSGYSWGDLWAFWLNVILGVLGAFTAAIVVGMALSTWGGSFFRWTAPAGGGLFLLVISNMAYVDVGEAYAVGSLSDWLCLLGTSVFFVYFLWDMDLLGRRLGSAND